MSTLLSCFPCWETSIVWCRDNEVHEVGDRPYRTKLYANEKAGGGNRLRIVSASTRWLELASLRNCRDLTWRPRDQHHNPHPHHQQQQLLHQHYPIILLYWWWWWWLLEYLTQRPREWYHHHHYPQQLQYFQLRHHRHPPPSYHYLYYCYNNDLLVGMRKVIHI